MNNIDKEKFEVCFRTIVVIVVALLMGIVLGTMIFLYFNY